MPGGRPIGEGRTGSGFADVRYRVGYPSISNGINGTRARVGIAVAVTDERRMNGKTRIATCIHLLKDSSEKMYLMLNAILTLNEKKPKPTNTSYVH